PPPLHPNPIPARLDELGRLESRRARLLGPSASAKRLAGRRPGLWGPARDAPNELICVGEAHESASLRGPRSLFPARGCGLDPEPGTRECSCGCAGFVACSCARPRSPGCVWSLRLARLGGII